MAPLTASALLVGSTGLTNLSSSRHRPPSLAPTRQEGWTEVWGGKDQRRDGSGDGDDDDEVECATAATPRYVTVTDDGCDYLGGRNGMDSDASAEEVGRASRLRLTQHRVAWFEQIVLRINRMPHVVENSAYAAAESTGGLPCLLDLSSREERLTGEGGKDGNDNSDDADEDDAKDDDVAKWGRAWRESLTRLDKPVLVGRNQPGGMGSNFFNHPRDGTPSAHPSWFLPSGSHIVDYLRLKHSRDMKRNLPFPEHLRGGRSSGDAMAYETLIRDKLDYILLALRYGNDPAWEGVYRPQCIRAAKDPRGTDRLAGSTRKSFFPLFAWYQIHSERSLALHNLLPSSHAASPSTHGGLAFELFRYNDYRRPGANAIPQSEEGDDGDRNEDENVHQRHPFSSLFPSYGGAGGGDSGRVNARRAMELADVYYASLEEKLASSGDDIGGASIENASKRAAYLLGTEGPTYVDALLFAHLAEALCDVHLILVLARHPRLARYFQQMYDKYFGKGYAPTWKSHSAGKGSCSSEDWIRENDIANALNAFNQIPEADSSKPAVMKAASVDAEGHDMIHAVRLMQQLAVHCNDLEEALRDAAALRTSTEDGGERALLESYVRPAGSRLYRWLMGGEVDFWPAASRAEKSPGGGDDDDARSQSDGEDGEEPASEEDKEKQRLFRERVERMKRDRRAQDELWLSGVVATVVVALFVSASGRRKQ